MKKSVILFLGITIPLLLIAILVFYLGKHSRLLIFAIFYPMWIANNVGRWVDNKVWFRQRSDKFNRRIAMISAVLCWIISCGGCAYLTYRFINYVDGKSAQVIIVESDGNYSKKTYLVGSECKYPDSGNKSKQFIIDSHSVYIINNTNRALVYKSVHYSSDTGRHNNYDDHEMRIEPQQVKEVSIMPEYIMSGPPISFYSPSSSETVWMLNFASE